MRRRTVLLRVRLGADLRSPWPFGRFSGQSCLSRFVAAGRGRKRKYGASMRAPVGETRVVCTSGCRSGFFEPFNCFGPDSRSGSEPLFDGGTKGVRKASAPVSRRCMEGRMQSKKGKGKERMFSDSQGACLGRIRAEPERRCCVATVSSFRGCSCRPASDMAGDGESGSVGLRVRRPSGEISEEAGSM